MSDNPKSYETNKKPNNKVKAHTRYYLKDGELAVGVTTALSILSKPALITWANRQGLQGIDTTKVKDQAANRGIILHLMICTELKSEVPDLSEYSQSDIDVASLCLDSWHEWRKVHSLDTIYVEKPLISEVYRYGGTPDWYGLLDGLPTILDFKTSNAIWDEYFYQLAAYRQLILENDNPIDKAHILRFSKGNNVEFEDRLISSFNNEFTLFKHCLSIYQLLKVMGRKL
ncbi:hypothetical protein M0R04_08395 [Candidatus Dojkabacteria bacterium]|jgi:hypothetical protein|nr:hypothetical protein [Candidatus Dojkabacteria bacterium]